MQILGTTDTSMGKRSTPLFCAVILLEIAYLYLRTKLMYSGYFHDLTIIEQELARSVVRAASIVAVFIACWYYKSFPDFFSKPKFTRTTIVLLILFFIQTLVEPKAPLAGLPVQMTFAATTIFVAVREELVYRFVIQNWLEGWLLPKDRIFGSILLTSIPFTLHHLGAQPVTSFPSIFLASLFLGAIYTYSGKSLSLVIAVHFVCDLFFV